MILDQFNLSVRTALVTGSSRGLGAGIALALAEAGVNVAVHGSSRMPEETLGQSAVLRIPRLRFVGEWTTR